MEKVIKQTDQFERIIPSQMLFFRRKKTVVKAGIHAYLKLVTHDKPDNSCSLTAECDYIVEGEKQTKHMALYQQRRFAKFEYPAASVRSAYYHYCQCRLT